MRIIATCDLHYNIARSRAPCEAIAREVCERGGDVLLLLGDLAGQNLAVLEHTFQLFESFPGPKLFVPGNHELWSPRGGDSMQRYEQEIPALCRRLGVHFLDEQPFIAGDTAIVGSVGWYDYTFRLAALGIPLRFYQHKIAPGAAARLSECTHLLDHRDDVPEAAMEITSRWMDGEHVRLRCSDCEFTERAVARLRDHLASVASAGAVVVGLHHLPFVELAPRDVPLPLQFTGAFLGSELLGEVLLEFPNVREVFCGHSHYFAQCRFNHLRATAIGSTYTVKRYEVLDV